MVLFQSRLAPNLPQRQSNPYHDPTLLFRHDAALGAHGLRCLEWIISTAYPPVMAARASSTWSAGERVNLMDALPDKISLGKRSFSSAPGCPWAQNMCPRWPLFCPIQCPRLVVDSRGYVLAVDNRYDRPQPPRPRVCLLSPSHLSENTGCTRSTISLAVSAGSRPRLPRPRVQ